MALRDQPYLPLYIQDIMTDEKLNECCAATHGIYIKGIMCLMHKSDQYGKILLKQKDKQTGNQIKNFAIKCDKHLPYTVDQIESAIIELVNEKVLSIEGDSLCQKRMIKDNSISELRSKAGYKGGTKSKYFAKPKQEPKQEPKQKANSEYESESEDENTLNKKGAISKLQIFEELFSDEIFVEQLAGTHRGKDIKQSFEECYTHHSNAPNPPSEVWEWKQKLNTWLTIKQSSNAPGKKTDATNARREGFKRRHGTGA